VTIKRCATCDQPFARGEIPTWVVRPGHLIEDTTGPGRCYACTGRPAPTFFGSLSVEDARAASAAVLDSKRHPAKYAGWHRVLNTGWVMPGVPGAGFTPSKSDVELARLGSQEAA
jgi:hypothetical protein